MIAEVDKRMPSVEGVRPAAGKTNLFDGLAPQSVGTSCGLLPGVLLQRLGCRGLISASGIEGRRLGVAVENDGRTLRKPGDNYWLRYAQSPTTDNVSHVGVTYDIDPNDGSVGTIADAGQDVPGQRCASFVQCRMQRLDGFFCLGGPSGVLADNTSMRRIGGWVDLDRLMARSNW